MDVLRIFMKEIYDFEMSDEQLHGYLDEKSNSLKIGNVLKDPLLHSNLTFRHIWKSITGVYPSRLIGKYFMTLPGIDKKNINIQQIWGLLIQINPVYQFISMDTKSLEQVQKTFEASMQTNVLNVKRELAVKFCYRYGIEPSDIDSDKSVFCIFKDAMFSKNGVNRLQRISTKLAKMTDKDVVSIPNTLNTVSEYFSLSEKIILNYELYTTNIFNKSVNNIIEFQESNLTVFDVINHVCSIDASFYRFLIGTTVIYWDSGDALTNNRLDILLKAANNHTSKNVVLFNSVENKTFLKTNNMYNIVYDVVDPFLLNFVPKLAEVSVTIGEYLYPISPPLSSKTNNSIYYCLYNEKPDETNPSYKYYYESLNRYIAPSQNVAMKIMDHVKSKHVYVISDTIESNSLINSDFVEHQWTAHFSTTCPYSVLGTAQYHPKMNVLLYDQFLLKYIHENQINVNTLNPCKKGKNVVVLVDNRENIFSVISLFITMWNLVQSEWSVVVICNDDNYGYFKNFFGDKVEYIRKFSLPSKKFLIDIYNDLLKDPFFWNSFMDYEKLLFVQDDGMIVKKGVEEEFLKYDYVGGPWKKEWATDNPNKFLKEQINPDLVGNGGVSLRNIKLMKRCCEKYKHISKQLHYDRMQQQPEDVFFSYCCVQEKANLPTYEKAKYFASEQVISDTDSAFGFHKTWVYHMLPDIEKMFNNYLNTCRL